MRIDKKTLGMILAVLGIVLIAVSYKAIYEPFSTNKISLESKYNNLEKKRGELQNLEDRREEYENGILEFNNENEKILKEYPSEIRPEDEIMRAVDYEYSKDPSNASIFFNSVSFGTPTIIPTENEDVTGYSLGAVVTNSSYQSTYKGLKSVIKRALQEQDKVVINSVSASMDESTGQLAGTMTITQYYITGQDKAYVEPIASANAGKNNIFNSFEIGNK